MNDIMLKPGDIFFTQKHDLLSSLIRIGTTSLCESLSEVSHVGLVVGTGTTKTANVVEALTTVQKHSLRDRYYNDSYEVAVFRPLNLTQEELASVVSYAEKQVGEHYGYLKLALHLMDWCLNGAYVFRRLAWMQDYPICSWLVAYAYGSVNKNFGVESNAASPDDIWDFCVKNTWAYECILPLGRLV